MDSADVLSESHSPLTILQIVAPSEVGGLESVVIALAAGQTRRGHKVIVAVVYEPRAAEHPFVAALTAAGVTAYPVVVSSRGYLRERLLIDRLCEREKPDIVHTHGYRPDIVHVASRLRTKFATVTTLHGSSRVGGSSTLHEILQLFLLRRFDAVIAVSRQLAGELRRKWVPTDRLHVIPNGWSDLPVAPSSEARRLLELPARGTIVGWVGRLIPIKGADVFLRAASRLGSTPATISVIGDGPERGALERLADKLGLSGHVRFHGSVSEAARLLSAFDVFVLSSRSEGTPVTLLEAMAANVPLVVTTVGGVPDVVTAAEAMLVPPEDPDALAEAIRHVLMDPAAAARRVQSAGRRLRSAFGIDRWIDSHDKVYSNILARRHKNG